MSVVIYRMEMIATSFPALESERRWNIEAFRNNQTTMKRFVKAHTLLSFEYAVLSTQLIQDITKLKSLHHIPEDRFLSLQKELAMVIRLSELLELLYNSYLNVPKKAYIINKERAICLSYFTSLPHNGLGFGDPPSSLIDTLAVRNLTARLNWLRLILVRTRRLLNTLIPILEIWKLNSYYIVILDHYMAPLFNYLSWLFYIPRFLVNSILLLKHLVPGPWMSQDEKQLGWITRLQAQLERRWFELVNDLGWGVAGLLCCFVLTGPVGFHFGIAFFLFDVITGIVRSFLDFRRYERLKADYSRLLTEAITKKADYLPELENYRRYMQERISYEQKKILLNFVTPIIILFAMCTALCSNPIVPFIGAIILVSTTIGAYLANRHFEKTKPLDCIKDNIKKLEKRNSYRFFTPAPAGQNCNTDPQITPRLSMEL